MRFHMRLLAFVIGLLAVSAVIIFGLKMAQLVPDAFLLLKERGIAPDEIAKIPPYAVAIVTLIGTLLIWFRSGWAIVLLWFSAILTGSWPYLLRDHPYTTDPSTSGSFLNWPTFAPDAFLDWPILYTLPTMLAILAATITAWDILPLRKFVAKK